MSRNEFNFKQFSIKQQRDVMKVGTDGVLLGSWTDPKLAENILDVGTGTGLLALMMAQKSNAMVDAIDIDRDAYQQANENFLASPWKDRLTAIYSSFQEFAQSSGKKYDLIISNPPFFLDAHKAESETRNISRHLNEGINIPDLVANVNRLLADEGRLCVIFPFREGIKFAEYAQTNGLYLCRQTKVRTKAEKQEKRMLLEFSKEYCDYEEDEIVIQDEEKNFTEQYRRLTSDFYLYN